MMKQLLFLLLFIFVGCNSQQDNSNGENDNLNFSEDQLGLLNSKVSAVDFGDVVLDESIKRFIEVENIGGLDVLFGETLFDEESFNSAFSYAGDLSEFPGEGGTCENRLLPGETCVLAFSFLPVVEQDDSTQVAINYENGLVEDRIEFNLSGYGGEEAALIFNLESIDFPITDVSNYQEITVNVGNTGGHSAENFLVELIPSSDDPDMFSIVSSKTTCPLSGELARSSSCIIVIGATIDSNQVYQDYFSSLNFEYEINPGNENVESSGLQIFQRVVSIEGELSVPGAMINFGDFVNGHISFRTFVLQNTGFIDLSLETVSITGDGGAASIDISSNPCTERDDERFNGDGKLLLGPNESCIMNLIISPNFPTIPFDFSGTDIHFTYDDGKNGIEASSSFSFNADLVNPARLEIQGSSITPDLETLNVGDVFVANDPRFSQTHSFTIVNNGDVIAEEVAIGIVGSPYFEVTHDCPVDLVSGNDCEVTLSFNPIKATYDANASTLNLASITTINYEAGDSNALNIPTISSSRIQTTGALNDLPQLFFSDFDTSTSTSRQGVAGSSDFFDIKIINLGVNPETSFDLLLSNSTNFFIIDDAALTEIEGVPNCALIDSGAGALNSGQECAYRIRSFSTLVEDLSSELSISFQGGAEISDLFTYNISFVNPAIIALAEPTPITKSRIRSYTDFNYPGVGSSTNLNATGVSSFLSTAPNAVPESLMSFSTLPTGEVFDLAYLELGFYPQGTSQSSSFSFTNLGEFEMTITDLSLVDVFDVTTSSDVSSSSIFTLDSSSGCVPSGDAVAVTPGGACTVNLSQNLPSSNIFRARLSVTYTLGHRVDATSEALETFTSDVTLYSQGYDASSVATLNISSPTDLVTSGELAFSEIFGGINTQSNTATIQNGTVLPATDVHFTVLADGNFSNVLDVNSVFTIDGLSLATTPLVNYFRLDTSECSGVVQDQIAGSENCGLNISFTPVSEDAVNLTIVYRYFNGITYEEGSFNLAGEGVAPAELVVQNLNAISEGLFSHDFGDSVVENESIFFVEVSNRGGANATNVQVNSPSSIFTLRPSTDSEFETCDVTIEPEAVCFLELVFSPTYSEIEQQVSGSLNFTWESGVIQSGPVNETITTTIEGSGFVEEQHSIHRGWTEVRLAGFNQSYADFLQANGTTQPNGQIFQPFELGLVSFKWNQMGDEGSIPNAIISYNIYKRLDSNFDIRNDTPYDNIPFDSAALEYEYTDDSLENIPGRVWFYYIVPVRAGGFLSRVDLEDFPAAIVRAVIPESYTVGLHRYSAAMEACKEMNIDINDNANIDPANNGCIYQNALGQDITFDVEYDTHMDMFEADEDYASNDIFTFNLPGANVVEENHDTARSICQAKSIRFQTSDVVIGGRDFFKDLPNRREHYIFSRREAGYTQEDCQVVDNEIITGEQDNCISDMGLENMAGGIPEWTIAQIDGFGRGIDTPLIGSVDTSIRGINYDALFNETGSGQRSFTILDGDNPIDSRCFNTLTGMFNPLNLGACSGDNLINLTSTESSAGPTTWYLAGTEPANTSFSAFVANDDISGPGGLSIFAVAGGGDELSDTEPNENYSPFTTDFTFDFVDTQGFRCSLRVPY